MAPLAIAAMSLLAVAAVACGNTEAPTAPLASTGLPGSGQQVSIEPQQVVTGGGAIGIPEPAGISGVSYRVSPDVAVYAPNASYNAQGASQAGIWVTGVGTKSVAADVGQVRLGVESRETTVAEARQKAAEAMTAVLDEIRSLGVDDDDIVTTSFNIYPQTVWVEVKDPIGTHSEPRITGYIVSNQVRVTVRDLDLLDEVIDAAADKGGDLIRVNSVSFTLDKPEEYGVETRQMAAADARAKAELYATAMGVTLGPLVYLSETGSTAPLAAPTLARADFAEAAAFAPTPIQSGDVSLSTTIQAVFAILP